MSVWYSWRTTIVSAISAMMMNPRSVGFMSAISRLTASG